VLLPPWTRAPLRSFRHPAVLLAVAAAAAILTCASSSAAWFLSSASSASLHRMVAAQCPTFTYPQLILHGTAADGPRLQPGVAGAFTGAGLPAPTRTEIAAASVLGVHGADSTGLRLWWGDGALDNITPLSTAGGDGVWLPTEAAVELDAKAGDTLTLGGGPVRVVGIYHDLYDEPVRPYWCPYSKLFANLVFDDRGPAPIAIATRPGVLTAALGGTDSFNQALQVNTRWTAAVDAPHLTVGDARRLVAAQEQAAATVGRDYRATPGSPGSAALNIETNPNLRDFADQATRIRDGLRGPVLPIALGGTLLALLLVGAAGSYWVDRRYPEVRLLASRGVGPAGLAALAALELAIPALLGAAAGLGLAYALVSWLGPAPELDSWAPRFAILTSTAALAAGLVLLAAVAGVRARNTVERPIGSRRRWPALVPWELALLAAAALAYNALRHGTAVRLDHNVAQVNLLLVAFPLLFLAGGAMLLVRLLTLLLPLVRRGSERAGPAVYLAARRVISAPLVSATVLAVVSLPIGVLAYSGAVTQTTAYMLDAKARVFTGGVVALESTDLPRDPAALSRVGTVVMRYENATVAGAPVTVLAIDPATFARYAFWDDRFGGALPPLLDRLRQRGSGGAVPAIAVRAPAGRQQTEIGNRTITLDVRPVAVLPGQRLTNPLYLVDAGVLGPIDNTAERFTEIWTDDQAAAQRAMAAQEMHLLLLSTDDSVRQTANFLGVTWAFGYLEALAALVGLVAVGGLLLYLETRQRTRVAGYALARRMGLSGRAHFGSLLAELGVLIGAAAVVGASLALLAVRLVYQRLDLDVDRPPPPLLSLPLADLAWAGLAAAVVAVAAAAYAHTAASRADASEVMRLGAG
jgi:putative ABC transport system permease protein